jgi:hypothetical protein
MIPLGNSPAALFLLVVGGSMVLVTRNAFPIPHNAKYDLSARDFLRRRRLVIALGSILIAIGLVIILFWLIAEL